jgi:hypothetical protein
MKAQIGKRQEARPLVAPTPSCAIYMNIFKYLRWHTSYPHPYGIGVAVIQHWFNLTLHG